MTRRRHPGFHAAQGLRGLLLLISAYACGVIGFIAAAASRAWESFALGIVALVLVLASPFLARQSRRMRTNVIDDLTAFLAHVKAKELPLFLYLRDFKVDIEQDHWDIERGEVAGSEEYLLRALRPFGATIAVGRPGETLPPGGAYRLYVSNREWQDVVARLIEVADAIVFRCGITPGVRWELKELKERRVLGRTLFVTGNIEESTAVYTWLRKETGMRGTEWEVKMEGMLETARSLPGLSDETLQKFEEWTTQPGLGLDSPTMRSLWVVTSAGLEGFGNLCITDDAVSQAMAAIGLERRRTGLFDTERPWQSENVVSALGIITAVAILALIPLAFLPVGDTLFGIVFVVAMAGFFLSALFRP